MNLKETYNLIAEKWPKTDKMKDWMKGSFNYYVNLFKPGAKILDVGCGTGGKSKTFLERGLQVKGIDFSENMIEYCRRNVPKGDFEVLDAYELRKLKGKYDGIFARAFLLHIPKKNVPKILKLMLVKLKRGGYMYVAVKERKPHENEEETKVDSDWGCPVERFFSFFTMPELKKFVTKAGMNIILEDRAKVGTRHWILVITQKI